MSKKFPPPAPPFIRARHQGGRQTPNAIVMHGTVSSDNVGKARDIALWWAGASSPVSSAHYVVDPANVIQCVGDHSIAFHCGFNTGSIGVELCDEQAGPASRWEDEDSVAILARAARLVAELCLAYDIEPRRPSVADLRKKGPHGIYGHNDSRLAFGRTTHTDPRDFDWPGFLRLVRLEIKKIRLEAKKAEEPEKPRVVVRVVHASMQFTDSAQQQASDAETIFARSAHRGVRWITGTEASKKAMRGILRDAAERHGYEIHFSWDTWVAVKRDQIIPDTFSTFAEKVIDGVKKRWSAKGVCSVTFETEDIGKVTVVAGHYLKRKGPDPALNRRLAKAIGSYMKKAGRGKALAFYGGDQNLLDHAVDTFFGEPITSLWDERGKYQKTHRVGNIDVIASLDKDGRVEGKAIHALDDGVLDLHTDHYLVEGAYWVDLI